MTAPLVLHKMATPSRHPNTATTSAAIAAIRKKLLPSTLNEVCKNVKEIFGSLDVHLTTSEISYNQVREHIVVCRKIKAYDENTGPTDTIRLVIDDNLQYVVYVYSQVFMRDNLSVPDDIKEVSILKQMADPDWLVCPGVCNYSTYQTSIGYDVKGVVSVLLPLDTARHEDCRKFFQRQKGQKSRLCQSCMSLKDYLASRKRNHDSLTKDDKSRHQEATSKVSFDYLSPASKKKRLVKMRSEISSLQENAKRSVEKMVYLELNRDNDDEVSKLIRSIVSSEAGQAEIDRILSEAEDTGKGRGLLLKSIWESDVSKFNTDQATNGKVL